MTCAFTHILTQALSQLAAERETGSISALELQSGQGWNMFGHNWADRPLKL
jgi:hypothetical protein